MLGMYLNVKHRDAVMLMQYVDDVLLFSTVPDLLHMDTVRLASDLKHGGWVGSPMSQLEASLQI